jgi:hypothetical protein
MEEYMKKLQILLVLAGLVALVAVMPVAAQNTFGGPNFQVKFSSKVPFYVNAKLMEPGDYTATQASGAQNNMLEVRGKGDNVALVQSKIVKIDGVTKADEVTFAKVNGKLYMDAVKLKTEPNKATTWIFKVRGAAE